MKKSFILLIVLFLSGCATFPGPQPESKKYRDFFGVKMDKITDARNFTIKGYDGETVNYNKGTGIDGSIYAWGDIRSYYSDYYKIEIGIGNKSNMPITTNYFSDSFALLTNDGKTYQLTKEDILSYPRDGVINPDGYASFRVQMPSNLKKEDVALILCSLGVINRTNIVLKPLPVPVQKEDLKDTTSTEEKKK